MSFLVPTQRGLEHVTQPIGDFSSIHNQPNRSHLPLSSLEGYPHQGMSALSTSTPFPPFPDIVMSQSLPKVGETRCCKFTKLYYSLKGLQSDCFGTFTNRSQSCNFLLIVNDFANHDFALCGTFRLVSIIVRIGFRLSGSCSCQSSRNPGRLAHWQVPPILCSPRRAGYCASRSSRSS